MYRTLTRMDGSAMERLLASRFAGGSLVAIPQDQGPEVYVPAAAQEPTPMPAPRRSHRRKPANQPPAATTGREQLWQGKPFLWPRPEGDDTAQPPPWMVANWSSGMSHASAQPRTAELNPPGSRRHRLKQGGAGTPLPKTP
jgi:hypothetical protein